MAEYDQYTLVDDSQGQDKYLISRSGQVLRQQRSALIEHIQSLIDSSITAGGPTANRPTNPATFEQYFDSTLGYPIWFNGTDWVDATGAAV